MRVRLHEALAPELVELLLDLGVEVDPQASVGLLGPGGELPRETLEIEEPVAWIALVQDEDQEVAALAQGANDVVRGTPTARSLEARVAAQRRMVRAWRRRMQAQQRQARRALDELANTQDLLGRLIDATPNPVMAVDVRGRVLVFNRAAELALGYDAEYARTQMHVTNIYANPADARQVLAELRANEGGTVSAVSVRLRARWGEQIPVELSAAEVRDAHGNLVATVGVFQDMREHVALKARLDSTTDQLIAAEHRNAAISKAAEAAFEINQPLTALMGTMEMLEMEAGLSERSLSRLARAQSHLIRIRDTVRAFGQLSRPTENEAGRSSRMSELLRNKDS